MKPVTTKVDVNGSQPARRIISLAREPQTSWPLDRRTSAKWKLRQRIAQAQTAAPHRWRRASLVVAVATASLVLALSAGLRSRSDPAIAPLEAPRPGESVAVRPQSRAEPQPSPVPEAWSQFALPDLGLIEISIVDAFELRELAQERRIRISAGELRAHILRQDPARPAVVETPHLRVVVVGTRFDVHVDPRRSVVSLLEGAVRVEANGTSVLLTAGSSIDSDDPRLQAAPPVSAGASGQDMPPPSLPRITDPPASERARRTARAPVAPACEALPSLGQQRACFERLARGSDLAAQNALYTLGIIARDVERQPERALDAFRGYGRRFPSGLHAPEAALGVLDLLQRKGLAGESIEAALEFERRFATDGRVPEVMLVRAELLCRDPARREEALALIDRVSLRRDPGVAAAAARARTRCLAADTLPGGISPAGHHP